MPEQKDLPLPEKELPEPHDMQLERPHDMLLPAHVQVHHHWPIAKHATVILILLTLVLCGFYLYVYSSLNRQLDRVTHTEKPADSSPSDQVQAVNTAGWQTYIDPSRKYSVKYPSDRPSAHGGDSESIWFYEPGTDINNDVSVVEAKAVGVRVRTVPFSETPKGNMTEQGVDFITGWREITVDGVKGVYYETHECAPGCLYIVALPYKNGQETIELFMTSHEDPAIFNAFVSTFRFSGNPQPTKTVININPTACTEEAMMCPDGKTYVGRVGPNCEFQACPQR